MLKGVTSEAKCDWPTVEHSADDSSHVDRIIVVFQVISLKVSVTIDV